MIIDHYYRNIYFIQILNFLIVFLNIVIKREFEKCLKLKRRAGNLSEFRVWSSLPISREGEKAEKLCHKFYSIFLTEKHIHCCLQLQMLIVELHLRI